MDLKSFSLQQQAHSCQLSHGGGSGDSPPLGSTFQAIVSVMAVKIQLSSPSGVRLSFSLPGILQHTTQMAACQPCSLHVAALTQSKGGHCSVVFTI